MERPQRQLKTTRNNEKKIEKREKVCFHKNYDGTDKS
jgi:hypothetical protein